MNNSVLNSRQHCFIYIKFKYALETLKHIFLHAGGSGARAPYPGAIPPSVPSPASLSHSVEICRRFSRFFF